MISEHADTNHSRPVFRKNQIIFNKFAAIFHDYQRADSLTHAVNRNQRRVFAVEKTVELFFISAAAVENLAIGAGFFEAIHPMHVRTRKFAAIDDFIDHRAVVKIIDERITLQLAFFIRDENVGFEHVRKHLRNSVVVDCFETLEKTIDLTSFF